METSRQKYGKSLDKKEQLLKGVENTVAKGEIPYNEQFLLLPQCFQKSSAAEVSENVSMWERVLKSVSSGFVKINHVEGVNGFPNMILNCYLHVL